VWIKLCESNKNYLRGGDYGGIESVLAASDDAVFPQEHNGDCAINVPAGTFVLHKCMYSFNKTR